MTQTFDETVKSPNSRYFSRACAGLGPVAGVHNHLKRMEFRRGCYYGPQSGTE